VTESVINASPITVSPTVWHGPAMFIDGQWMNGDSVQVTDKYTGDVLGTLAEATPSQVDAAINAADVSFRERPLSSFERYEILLKMSAWIRRHESELIQLLIAEVGKTYKDTKVEVDRAYHTYLLSAEEAKRIGGEVLPLSSIPGAESKTGFAARFPKGVIGAITPFNYPFLLASHKIAPAIASGNTIVIKPAPNTPFSTVRMVQGLHECGLPEGHVQVIQGGPGAGDALLANPKIQMYTFTGSARIGQYIKEHSGLRPVVLELGNSSPNIVCNDADLHLAALRCGARAFTAAGQACISVQRILVQDGCWDAFLPKFLNVVTNLKVGNPYQPDTDVGPMISEREAIRAEQWVAEAVNAGAQVLCGNERNGAFFQPTVLVNAPIDSKVCREEVFAPVAVLIPFKDIDEAIAIANDTPYGLHAGLFTQSMPNIMKAWRELVYGGVIVNDTSTFRSDLAPYGGLKNSGLGKEGPRYAIESMTHLKVLVIDEAQL
jgi:acyl-CoA reductase-like NAD-dependent aldehyde dehydrogenase